MEDITIRYHNVFHFRRADLGHDSQSFYQLKQSFFLLTAEQSGAFRTHFFKSQPRTPGLCHKPYMSYPRLLLKGRRRQCSHLLLEQLLGTRPDRVVPPIVQLEQVWQQVIAERLGRLPRQQ